MWNDFANLSFFCFQKINNRITSYKCWQFNLSDYGTYIQLVNICFRLFFQHDKHNLYLTKESGFSREKTRKIKKTISSLILFSLATDTCISFHYSMYGEDISTLSVSEVRNGVRNKLWSKSGDQGQKWHRAALSVKTCAEMVRKITIFCGNSLSIFYRDQFKILGKCV